MAGKVVGVLFVIVGLLSCLPMAALAAEAADQIKPGDIAVVIENGTRFGLGTKLLAELEKGANIKVTEIRGDFIGGHVVLNGAETPGWIKKGQVRKKPEFPSEPPQENVLGTTDDQDADARTATTPETKEAPSEQAWLTRHGFFGAVRVKTMSFGDEGIALGDEVLIDLLFGPVPKVKFGQEGGEPYFAFEQPMPESSVPGVVVFSTPSRGAQATIPAFKPVVKQKKGRVTTYHVKHFHGHRGEYDFEFDFVQTGHTGGHVARVSCFTEGSTHHIFGEVNLFGVKFKNPSEKTPLVFKILDGKYVHVKGNGIATLGDAKSVEFHDESRP